MGKSTISMAVFHCYVSSPEGIYCISKVSHAMNLRSLSHCLRLLGVGTVDGPRSHAQRPLAVAGALFYTPGPQTRAPSVEKSKCERRASGDMTGTKFVYIMVYREILGCITNNIKLLVCPKIMTMGGFFGMSYFQTKPFEKWRGVCMA